MNTEDRSGNPEDRSSPPLHKIAKKLDFQNKIN